MNKFINRALKFVFDEFFFQSHIADDPANFKFYQINILGGHKSFAAQFVFFKYYFILQIEWVLICFFFQKTFLTSTINKKFGNQTYHK